MKKKGTLIAMIFLTVVLCAGAQSISSLTPTNGPIGTQVTIDGSGFAATGNIVHFQSGTTDMIYEARITAPSQDGMHLTFTVPSNVEPLCRYQTPSCPALSLPVYDGMYIVFVEVAGTNGNAVSFNVTGSPTPGPGPYSLTIQSSIISSSIHIFVDPPGGITEYPVSYTYTSPTTVTIDAYDYITMGGVRIVFVGWSGALTGVSRNAIFTVNGEYSITANYEYQSDVPTVAPTPAPTAGVECNGFMGDANQDGNVNIVDALVIAKSYVGAVPPIGYNPLCADVNRDGVITIVDALIVAQCYVGLRTCDF
jgi:hypothetical protein